MSSTATQVRALPRRGALAVERARLRVVPRPRARASRIPFVVLVSALLVGGVIGLLLFNTSMQQASFAESELKVQATTLAARQQTLEMETERLRDPQRVARRAQDLGMRLPGSVSYLRLADGTVLAGSTEVPASTVPLLQPTAHRPAVLDPAPQVTVVDPPSATATSPRSTDTTGDTGRPATSEGQVPGRTESHKSQQTQKPRQSQNGQHPSPRH